jgi:small subunit ribosomal protein S6
MEEEIYKQRYEIMVILLPNLGEEGSKKELNEIKSLITSEGGEIVAEDIWGVRDLAYRIKKEDQGYYAVLNLDLDPSKIKEVEESMNLNQKIVRQLILKIPKNYTLRTFEQFEEERVKIQEEEQKKRKEREEKSTHERSTSARRPESKRTEEKTELKTEPKKAAPKKEATKKEAPKKEKVVKEEKKSSLDDVDEKLKNIINDPDISL